MDGIDHSYFIHHLLKYYFFIEFLLKKSRILGII
jgi:hypothetical protein